MESIDARKAEDSFPTMINDNGESVTSQKKIAEVMAKYFCKKVDDIKTTFDSNKTKAMTILKKLTKQRTDEFEFKKLTREEVYEIILKVKSSRTVANDAISMDLLKQIPHIMSLILMHLFNRIIETKKFPKALKVSRIIPLRKKNKCRISRESYCPVSILNPVEKLIEEMLRIQIVSRFEINCIMPIMVVVKATAKLLQNWLLISTWKTIERTVEHQ